MDNRTGQKSKISIIIPTLNEEGNVHNLVKRIDASLRTRNIGYDLIFIDDHSKDNTLNIIQDLSGEYPVSLHLKEGKRGKGYSIVEGFRHVTADLTCIIDADLQYPPEVIPEMIQKITDGHADMVIADRDERQLGFVRKFFSKGFKFFFGRLLHGFRGDIQSGLKVFRTRIIKEVIINPSPWAWDLELALGARDFGWRIDWVPILFGKRTAGQSTLNVFSAAKEIGLNAVKMKFRSRKPQTIPAPGPTMAGAGIAQKGKRFITHTTLPREISAFTTFTRGQKFLIAGISAGLGLGFFFYPLPTAISIIAVLSVVYFADSLFNLFLVLKSLHRPPELKFTEENLTAIDNAGLPVYSILCPLYRESRVLPGFIKAVENIDWPKNKLDVLLLLEENDRETIETAKSMGLPDYVRIVIVPHSLPKTKPKACNYGLSFAKGEFLVIYDAEDVPEPSQLKKAFLGFRTVPQEVKCLQAKLNYFNPEQNLLTRMFTSEYSLWFDITLPGLQSINTSIPLGGTSNHFRTKDLVSLKGWDPFNVTEDCDLGIRLFKMGYRTAILDSVTLEEANSNLKNWIRQRSRWVKGYMQTYLVHMRNPFSFFKRSPLHFMFFQFNVGGKIAFSLINPVLWATTIAYFAFRSTAGPVIEQFYPSEVLYISVFSLVFGNFLYLYYYMIGCAKREQWYLVKYVFFIPFYWLSMSVASLMALYELIVKPHYWQKTNHGLNLAPAGGIKQGPALVPEQEPVFVPEPEPVPVLFSVRPPKTDTASKPAGPSLQLPDEPQFVRPPNQSKPVIRTANAPQPLPDSQYIRPQPAVNTQTLFSIENKTQVLPVSSQAEPQTTDKEKKVIFSRGAVLIMAMMFANFTNFAFNAFLGRKLSLEDLGLITLINTFWYLASIFINSISSTVNHRTAYLSVKEGTQAAMNFWKITLRMAIITSIIASGIWIMAIPFLSEFFRIDNRMLLLLFTPTILCGVIVTANRGFLQGNMMFHSTAIITVAEASAKLIIAAALVYLGWHGWVFTSIPGAILFTALVAFGLSFNLSKKLKLSVSEAKTVSKYEFPKLFYAASVMSSISSAIFLSLDIVLVKHYLAPADAGAYALLSLVGKMIYFFGSLPAAFMITFVSRAEGLGKRSEKTLYSILLISFVMVITGFVSLGWYGNMILPIMFGSKINIVLQYVRQYALAISLFTFSNILISYHLARKQYIFPVASLFASGLMAFGIISSHDSIGAVVNVITSVSVFSLSTMVLLHILEPKLKFISANAHDFIDAFVRIPKSPPLKNGGKRVLIFNWRDILHIYSGGAEVYIQEIAKRMVEKGNEVTIFSGNDGKSARNEIIDGVHMVRRGGFYFVYFWAFVYYFIQFRGNYDVVIDGHNGIPFFTPLFVKEPVICIVHHVHQEVFRMYLPKPLAAFARFLERDLMPVVYRNIHFVTVSPSSKKEMIEYGLVGKGIEIIYNGVDLDNFKPAFESPRPMILYLGRLKAYKSVDVLITSFRILLKDVPDAKLVIAGSGEEESHLKRLAGQLGLTGEQITFTGHISHEEKIDLLQKAWVMVNPSFMEGWGITTIEANACGTPVIGSDIPGLRDSVKNLITGYLVTYGDSRAFAEKMKKIIIDHGLRNSMARESRRWAENFSWSNTGNNFSMIIKNKFKTS